MAELRTIYVGPAPLPCPFCGSTDLAYNELAGDSYVTCNGCNTCGPDGGIEAWNQRPDVETDR